jgi:hypothetical protein
MVNPEILKREKMLFTYSLALEQGDFARLETILEMAASDAVLERQIIEINAVLSQPGATATQAAAYTPQVNLWQRIKSFVMGLFSIRIRHWPALRTVVLGLGLFAILLLGVLALLGPAVGKVFSNAVIQFPISGYPMFPAQPTQIAGTQLSYTAYPAPLIASPLSNQTASQPSDRMIVHDGSLTIVANDTRLARQSIEEMVSEFAVEGAFVVSSNETYPSSGLMPVVNMVLRVPVARYDESMNRIANLGIQVVGRTETAQDVTQDYVDTTARIQALETSRDRLLEIIKEAKNTDDLLRAEQELSSRETEIEAAKARQQNLAKTAALSSITVSLRPAVTSQPVVVPGWDPAATLHDAMGVFLTGLRGFADGAIFFVITTLPWLVVIGLLIFGVVRLIVKKPKK